MPPSLDEFYFGFVAKLLHRKLHVNMSAFLACSWVPTEWVPLSLDFFFFGAKLILKSRGDGSDLNSK